MKNWVEVQEDGRIFGGIRESKVKSIWGGVVGRETEGMVRGCGVVDVGGAGGRWIA